jgi:hypothetical protein
VSYASNASQSSSVSMPSNVYKSSNVSNQTKQPKPKQPKPKQPKVKPATTVNSPTRCSQRLKKVKRLKNNDGPGCSADKPMTIDNEEEGAVMTQESAAVVPAKVPAIARLGAYLNYMKPWGELSTRSTQ